MKDFEFRTLGKQRQAASLASRVFTFIASTLGVLGLVIIYSVIGGFLFVYLESTHEQQTIESGRGKVEAKIQSHTTEVYKLLLQSAGEGLSDRVHALEILEEQLFRFFTEVHELVAGGEWDGSYIDEPLSRRWTFTSSLLFSVTTITSIGYGTIAPSTQSGRITCIFYALFGLPLTALCVANIGLWFARQVRLMLRKLYIKLQKEDRSEDVPVLFSLITMGIYMMIGTAMFCTWEDWSAVDGVYFSFITLTTIGFGDLVPSVFVGELDENNGLLQLFVSGFYLFFGLAILAMCMDLLKEEVKNNFLWLVDRIPGCSRETGDGDEKDD